MHCYLIQHPKCPLHMWERTMSSHWLIDVLVVFDPRAMVEVCSIHFLCTRPILPSQAILPYDAFSTMLNERTNILGSTVLAYMDNWTLTLVNTSFWSWKALWFTRQSCISMEDANVPVIILILRCTSGYTIQHIIHMCILGIHYCSTSHENQVWN